MVGFGNTYWFSVLWSLWWVLSHFTALPQLLCYGGLNIRNAISQVDRGNPSLCPLSLKLSRVLREITEFPLSKLTLKWKQWAEFRRCISTATPPSNTRPTPPRLTAKTNFNDGRSLSLPRRAKYGGHLFLWRCKRSRPDLTQQKAFSLMPHETWGWIAARVQFSAKGF